jgi:hypothetical protein
MKKYLLDRIVEINGCWVWIKARNGYGYGYVRQGKRMIGAHRLSYTTFVGPIPSDALVLHRCNNPPCINPEHLYLGTRTDNINDWKESVYAQQPRETETD